MKIASSLLLNFLLNSIDLKKLPAPAFFSGKANYAITSLFFLAFMGYTHSLKGEIERIDFTWNAFKCLSACSDQIQGKFGTIKGIKELKVNASEGRGEIKWDPEQRLSYEPFRYAAASIGFKINSIRLRVKGKIEHEEGRLYLISEQDGTRFHLIGPIHTEEGRYTPKYNLATHPLPKETVTLLLETEKEENIILIEGPLFLPSYYPLTLVTESIQKG